MGHRRLRRATTATALALLACMGAAGAAEARGPHVSGSRILDARGNPMTIRGVAWGGERFVGSGPDATLPKPDISKAGADFRRIRRMGANLVRIDVSSAADDDAHRLALQRIQRLAKANGLQLLLANVPLENADQTTWLRTLASWFPGASNVWYLPEVDPNCGVLTADRACTDTEAWIWNQGNAISALRSAGVRTPIVVNTPGRSRSVTVPWARALHDRNLVFGVHPLATGAQRWTDDSARAMRVSLRHATRAVPVIFDDVSRVQTSITLARGGRQQRRTVTAFDAIQWSQGLLDWATGWTVLDGGDGAIVDGFGTTTRDRIPKGGGRFTAWGRSVASGFFAITYRQASGRDPGSGFPGGFELGARGPGVRAMQADLWRHGFLGRRFVNGTFDDATWQAVVAFQGYTRDSRTGTAGAETLASIRRGVVPVPRYPQRGKHIEVDISRQIVLLVDRRGRVERVIHTSTGATGNTPDGQFSIIRKEMSSWVRAFQIYLPYANYFYEGFALHEYPDVPEYPASHGCVRLHPSNSPVVWAFADLGTPVILYHSGGSA